MRNIFKFLLWIISSLIGQNAFSQKLPNVQVESLRAPSNLKVDGQFKEWGNKFQAFNKTTQIFYNIANDDTNLYLVIKITDNDTKRKAVLGGITLFIDDSDKGKAGSKIAITFPTYEKREQPDNSLFNHKPSGIKDSILRKSQVDSLRGLYVSKFVSKSKMIAVEGIDDIKEEMISIYNDINIRAAFNFDDELSLIFELAVPLKKIRNLDKHNVYYQVQLNGLKVDGKAIRTLPSRPNYFLFTDVDGSLYSLGAGGSEVLDLMTPTNFNGVYVLDKNVKHK